jgi:hypothetical protein
MDMIHSLFLMGDRASLGDLEALNPQDATKHTRETERCFGDSMRSGTAGDN